MSSLPPARPQRSFIRRFRLLKAYGLTLRVLWSYLTFNLAGWLRGPDWVARKRPDLDRRNARRVVRLILDLKGLFIKVGQLISILTNFLPETFRKELEGLQDQIPPRPVDEIAGRIRDELGQEPSVLFASFETTPLASASLAQVHEAYLHDGRRVAVKVQHLDIEAVAAMDLRTIRRLLGLVSLFIRVRGLTAQYEQLEAMIHEELDFTAEARHIETIAAHFEGDPEVGFPQVVHERSTRRVLTTTFIEGTKVTDLAALDARGIDRNALAERVVAAYCQMVFRDGIYHADPHPGNILVRPDGSIVFIDFGAVARLSPEMQAGIPQFLMGILLRDRERILHAFQQMGFVAREGHEETLTHLIAYVHERFLGDLSLDTWQLQDLDAETVMAAKLDALADFRRFDLHFRDLMRTFQVPKDFILLGRTVMLLMGLCTHLNPEMNPVRTIRPYLEAAVLGPEKDWKAVLGSALKDMALDALALPDEMRRLLSTANQGALEVRVRGLQESTNLIYALGHQLLYGFLALGTGTLAYVAHLRADAELTLWFAVASGFFALCLGGSLLRARKM